MNTFTEDGDATMRTMTATTIFAFSDVTRKCPERTCTLHHSDSMSSTAIIVAWTCALIVVVYTMFVVRYYYRVPDVTEPITIVQCQADTFTASLLRERMPVVCRGVGDLAGFKTLAKSTHTGVLGPSVSDPLYASLRIPGWCCRHAAAVVHTTPSTATEPLQSLADVALDVQLVGTRRVALWVPTATCNTNTPLRRVDVVLSPGDGLFIPFQWWKADTNGDGSTVTGTNENTSRWCALRWNNLVTQSLDTQRWFGACGTWQGTV